MDSALLHALNGIAYHHHGIEAALAFYERGTPVVFAAVLVLCALWPYGDGRLRRGAVAGGLAAALALACAQILTRLWDRPRPFVADPGAVHLFAAHGADSGFPSDHAVAAFAIAVALLLRDRRWGAGLLGLATLLAVGRVALGVHYPTDVLAGAVLGGGMATLLYVSWLRERIDAVADRAGRMIGRPAGLAAGNRPTSGEIAPSERNRHPQAPP